MSEAAAAPQRSEPPRPARVRSAIGGDLARMGYRRIVLLLVYLGIVPAVLLSALGVIMVFLGEARILLLMGILVLTFTGTLVTGVILVWVFVRRERDLSELQADFVSKVSHELRTPLTSIRMFSETLVLRRGDREAEDKCIGALDRESARLQELIDRLLDWGRMESGRRIFEMDWCDARAIAEDAVEAFAPTRERRDVEVRVEVDRDVPPLFGDRAALVDAIVNLLSNAYKYGGDPRKIRIRVSASDRWICFSVQDNGPGIAEREHRRIFEKFYRVDDLLARRQEGSGLGLAIVQHVIKAHRGRIDVDSERGKGTTIHLHVPRRREEEAAAASALAESGDTEGTRDAEGGAR